MLGQLKRLGLAFKTVKSSFQIWSQCEYTKWIVADGPFSKAHNPRAVQ